MHVKTNAYGTDFAVLDRLFVLVKLKKDDCIVCLIVEQFEM